MGEGMKTKIIIFLLLLLPGGALAGSCGGFVLFAGYGYDNGPFHYKKDRDMQGDKLKSYDQFIYGIEYNFKYIRFQYEHGSDWRNSDRSSFGDSNELKALFKLNF